MKVMFFNKAMSALGLSVIILVSTSTFATPIVLDFESHASGNYVSGTTIPEAAKLSDEYLGTHGVLFRSISPYVAVVNLGAGHATSGTKGIGGATIDGKVRYNQDTPIIADFFNPTNTSQMATTDFVSLISDNWPQSGTPDMQLEGYDIYGQLLAIDSAPDTGGVTLSLSLSASGIHSVRFYGHNVAWDDFTFNPVTPIPEPASASFFALSIIGGMWIRRIFNS